MPTTQVNHRKDPFFNINSLRPRLGVDPEAKSGEKTPEEAPAEDKKPDSALNSSAYRTMLGVPDGKKNEMRLPVVGYTGHRQGYRAQNFYGKNFKDCAI